LLLCACAPTRQKEEPQRTYASKPFPPKFYPPAIYPLKPIAADRLSTIPMTDRAAVQTTRYGSAMGSEGSVAYEIRTLTDTVYLQNTVMVDSLNRELEIEQLANQAIRKRLQNTEADRDYWQEKNRQKFWALIAMGVFGFLYILFTLLASRIKDT
jgi:hypothetical protein